MVKRLTEAQTEEPRQILIEERDRLLLSARLTLKRRRLAASVWSVMMSIRATKMVRWRLPARFRAEIAGCCARSITPSSAWSAVSMTL